MNTRALIIVTVVAIGGGCVTEVHPGGLGPSLPVAVLACPAHAQAGVAFTLDGTASLGVFDTISLAVGDVEVKELTGSFTVASPGMATARLALTDKQKHVGEARCRIVVDGEDTGGEGEGAVGGEGEGAVAVGEGEGEGSVDPDPTGPPPPGTPVDLSGTFALVAYDHPQMEDGLLDPGTQCGTAPQVSLVTLAQSGNHISMSAKYCSLVMPPVQILGAGVQHTTVPNPLIDAFAPIAVEFDLENAVTGASFTPPMDQLGTPQIVGAHLTDPYASLPTDGNDPLVHDDDNDTYHGVTIEALLPQDIVYRREYVNLSGTIVSADEIDGLDVGDYQSDADSSLLSIFSFMVPTGHGLPSTFKMTRVSASSCADIRPRISALLASLPAPQSTDDCPIFQ